MSDVLPDAAADSSELAVECFIAAPPEKVWAIMTERLAEWWCPRPWRTEIIEMDWRPGGRDAMVLRGPNPGEEHVLEGVFLEVVPGSHWISTDAFRVGWIPQEPFMTGKWSIAPEGDGTRYRASARHWSEEASRKHAEMGFEEGWAACAAQLKALCEAA